MHYILSFSHEGYGRATSIATIKEKIVGPNNKPPYLTPVPAEYYTGDIPEKHAGRRANAAIVILARNGDLQGVVHSMKQLEDRFNKKFGYPYVLLNEEKFSDDFKK